MSSNDVEFVVGKKGHWHGIDVGIYIYYIHIIYVYNYVYIYLYVVIFACVYHTCMILSVYIYTLFVGIIECWTSAIVPFIWSNSVQMRSSNPKTEWY